jgi:dihydroflavonol-4-reductase
MSELLIVTGGAGFIGTHLVSGLVDSGHDVRVVERPGAEVAHLPKAADVVFADIRDRTALARAFKGAKSVYHLAANPHLWAQRRADFREINFAGTVNVLDAALAAGASRVLHTSTESILTKAKTDGPIDENVQISWKDAVGPYCRSKLLAEQYAFLLARQGRPVVVANPTMPVGPGDRGLSPPTRLILDFCRGALPAWIHCTLNLIDVRDVALGLRLVMERGQIGRRYLLGHINLTLEGLLGLLGELTGVPVPRWRVPYPAALVAAVFSEFCADWLTHREPKACLTGVRLGRRIMHFDSSRSRAEIGLFPRPIQQSLADAVGWLRQTGKLRGP